MGRTDEISRMQDVLEQASEERDQRMDLTQDADGRCVVAWVLHERQAMLDATNALCDRLGTPRVSAQQILDAENTAVGHSDYASKFAMRCVDLAYAMEVAR